MTLPCLSGFNIACKGAHILEGSRLCVFNDKPLLKFEWQLEMYRLRSEIRFF
jgi:hypothetical protein